MSHRGNNRRYNDPDGANRYGDSASARLGYSHTASGIEAYARRDNDRRNSEPMGFIRPGMASPRDELSPQVDGVNSPAVFNASMGPPGVMSHTLSMSPGDSPRIPVAPMVDSRQCKQPSMLWSGIRGYVKTPQTY
jgi:hypothetical protein